MKVNVGYAYAQLVRARQKSDAKGIAKRGTGGQGRRVQRQDHRQCQILTTHNLGVLFDRLALEDSLAPYLRSLAERCMRFVVKQLRLRGSSRDMLARMKNAAYAWRQMVFYLSFTPDAGVFAQWVRTTVLARTDAAFRTRFEPAMRGLELAASGVHSSWRSFASGGGRLFTGWSCGDSGSQHWLAPLVS